MVFCQLTGSIGRRTPPKIPTLRRKGGWAWPNATPNGTRPDTYTQAFGAEYTRHAGRWANSQAGCPWHEAARSRLHLPSALGVSTCGLLLCPPLQRLVQKHVNHIHPRPKLLLCECVHTLDQLLWEPEAEHHAALLLLHVYETYCPVMCRVNRSQGNQYNTLPSSHCNM